MSSFSHSAVSFLGTLVDAEIKKFAALANFPYPLFSGHVLRFS